MRYIKQIINRNKKLVFVYFIIGLFNAFLVNFKADYFQKIIDSLAEHTLSPFKVLIYGSVLFIGYLMNYADEYPAKKLEHGIFLDFKLMGLEKISRISYQEYQKLGTGKLVQRIENGASAGKGVVFDFGFVVVRNLFPTVLFSILFIWQIDKRITIVLLLGYIIIFFVTNILLKFLYQMKERILNNEEELNRFLVRGFMEMIVFRMEHKFPNELRKARGAKKEIVDTKVKMNMIHEAFFTIFALLVACLDIAVLVYAWQTDSLSVGAVVALITLIDNAYTPIAIFNVIYVQYKLNRTAFSRYKEFLDMQDDKQLVNGIAPQTFSGKISVKNLSFQYGEKQVLNNISFEIRSGDKVAFVGETGSGKSTIIKLLTGLLKYDEGEILLDGYNLADISLEALYKKITYLPQETPVFDGTVKENIVFDRNIPDTEVRKALERVELSSLIDELPKGMDTQIGEKAASLSGGERQRLALSRIWLKNSDIVIFDEATSALDNLTEGVVMERIFDYLSDTTVLAIVHRFTNIQYFDRILVFRDGKIVGQGTFDELMKNDEYFAKLYLCS
ncbi:MAG: ABC transporter ATP-binding protein/permease [Clostridiales bacterium]|nr:ABC transporter ATP-binding protein/permease [Clostridiales bacterium]